MGSKVSEHVTKKFNATSNRLFRPLSGNKVSEPKREVTLWSQRKSFRPLSGSKVSERYNYYEYSREWKKFPSPRGD